MRKVKPFYHNLTQEQRNTVVAAATVSSYANLNEFVSDALIEKAEYILNYCKESKTIGRKSEQ